MKRLTSFLVALFLATTALWAYDFKVGDLCYSITDDKDPYTVEVVRPSRYNSSNKGLIGYNLRTVVIPEHVTYDDVTYTVTSIGEYAFYNSGLTSIVLPSTLLQIGEYAFHYTGIRTIQIPASVTTIQEGAFANSLLESIEIPDNITEIDKDAFKSCSNLKTILLDANLSGDWVPSSIESITFGEHCDSIPAHICSGNDRLTSVTISGNVKKIGEYAFNNCTGLKKIKLPEGLISIEDNAFQGCTGLSSIDLPQSLVSIGYYAFSSCTSLTSIVIPDNVTTIAPEAFGSCTGLTSVTIGKSVTSIFTGDYAGSAFEKCSGIFSVTWNARNCQDFRSSNGSPFGKLSTGIVLFSFGDEVENIPDYLCYGMTNLLSVDLPASLKRIGKRAFQNCSGLEDIALPEGLQTIDEYAFYSCSALTSVTLPTSLRTVEQNAFRECSNLTVLDIKEGVEFIGDWAFAMNPKIETVTVPKTVKHIGNAVFTGCTGLRSIVWNVIAHADFTSSSSPFNSTTVYSEPRFTTFTFGSDVQYIPAYLCHYQRKLKSVVIPDNVLSIGDYAFYYCDSLAGIHIGANVREIGQYSIQSTPWYKTWWAAQDNGEVYINSVLMGYHGTMPANTTVKVKKWTTCIAANAFSAQKNLTDISIPATVTTIGSNAFYNCTGLTSFTIPGNVKRLGSSAFSNCKNITSLTIAEGVDSIGNSAFSGCTGLTSIVIPSTLKTINSSVFSGCTGLTSITISEGVQTIQNYAFYGCKGLTSITIPSTVVNCESNITPECSGLKSVVWNAKHCADFGYSRYLGEKGPFSKQYNQITSFTFGEGVEKIPSGICQHFSALVSVTIPASVTSIESSAFYGCSVLPSVTIPEGVTYIGGSAFYGCNKLRKLTVPASVDSVGYNAFNATGLQQVIWNPRTCKDISTTSYPQIFSTDAPIISFTFDKEAERIPAGLCKGLGKLVNIAIPNSVKYIGRSAFEGCGALTTLTIGDGVEEIATHAFSKCTGLQRVTFGKSLKYIQEGAFYYCSKLESVILPDSIEYIGWSAFEGNSSLETLVIGNNPRCVTVIDDGAFGGCSQLKELVIPDGVKRIGGAFGGCSSLAKVTIGKNVECIADKAFGGADKITTIVWNAKRCADITYSGHDPLFESSISPEVTFGDEVESIPARLFYEMKNLKTITLPKGLKRIGKYAFQQTGLEGEIVFPEGVEYIGDYAFMRSNLTSFVIPQSLTYVGDNALYTETVAQSVEWNAIRCNTSKYGTPFSSSVTNFVFGDNVKRIPCRLCSGLQNVKVFNIPNSVVSIENNAFRSTNPDTIYIGKNVKYIGEAAFSSAYKGTHKAIVSSAVTPPHCDTLAFSGIKKTISVQVPCGALEAYSEAACWKDFTKITAAQPEFTLTLQTEDEKKGSVTFDEPLDCSLTATISATPTSGYLFVQWSDGSTDNPRTLTITDDITLIALFSTPTGIDDAYLAEGASGDNTPRKVFYNGQVYILRGGKTYTATGVEVKQEY